MRPNTTPRVALSYVEEFLLSGKYPNDLLQEERFTFQRKCKNFKVEESVLYHKRLMEEGWKVVVKEKNKKQRITVWPEILAGN